MGNDMGGRGMVIAAYDRHADAVSRAGTSEIGPALLGRELVC